MNNMWNRLLFIILLCSIITISCAGLKTERGVQDNTFYSSLNPSINIRVDSAYDYQKTDTKSQNVFSSTHTTAVTNMKYETYVFFNSADEKRIIIRIAALNNPKWYMKPADYSKAPNIIMFGTEEFNNKKYQYGVYPIIYENSCYLLKDCERIVGSNDNVRFNILFADRLGDKSLFYLWNDKKKLNSDQEEHIRVFLEDFKKDITVSSYSKMTP